MKIKTVRVNIKQEKRERLISCYFTLNGYISFMVYSVYLPLVVVSFLFSSQLDLPVKGNKENKFKNWLKYNNKCLIAFCTDRVQVPDPLQYSNDCIRNAPRSDEGIGEGIVLGRTGGDGSLPDAYCTKKLQELTENGKLPSDLLTLHYFRELGHIKRHHIWSLYLSNNCILWK